MALNSPVLGNVSARRAGWVLAILIAFGVSDLSAAQQFTLGQATGVAGQTASPGVTYDGDQNVAAAQFDILYPADKVSPSGIIPGGALTGHAAGSSVVTPGRTRVVFYSATNGILSDGLLANLIFVIASNAPPGLVSLTISDPILAGPLGNTVSPVSLLGGSILVSLTGPAEFESISVSTNGRASFLIRGTPAQGYVIQSSSNLATWTDVSTNSAVGGVIEFTDTSTPAPTFRFYRARSIP